MSVLRYAFKYKICPFKILLNLYFTYSWCIPVRQISHTLHPGAVMLTYPLTVVSIDGCIGRYLLYHIPSLLTSEKLVLFKVLFTNKDFNQCLVCAAPKRRSKYTSRERKRESLKKLMPNEWLNDWINDCVSTIVKSFLMNIESTYCINKIGWNFLVNRQSKIKHDWLVEPFTSPFQNKMQKDIS